MLGFRRKFSGHTQVGASFRIMQISFRSCLQVVAVHWAGGGLVLGGASGRHWRPGRFTGSGLRSTYPIGHRHVNPNAKSKQSAIGWQSWVPSRHSFMAEKNFKIQKNFKIPKNFKFQKIPKISKDFFTFFNANSSGEIQSIRRFIAKSGPATTIITLGRINAIRISMASI